MSEENSHYDDFQFADDGRPGQTFTHHGTPVLPVDEEDTIRSDAANVVQSIPLPDDSDDTDSHKASSSVFGEGGVQQSDIESLSAEDIREDDYLS